LPNLGDLATAIGGKPFGDPSIVISGVSEIQNGEKGTITFLANPKYKQYLTKTQASAVVVNDASLAKGKSGIIAENPQLAFSKILEYFQPDKKTEHGIHATAQIHPSAKIGNNISVGPYSVIEAHVKLGDNIKIDAHVTIGKRSSVGNDGQIMAGVNIYHDCSVGNNVIIHSGTVIGCDGFGFIPENDINHKIPQIGKVVIGDDVEIGANCSIDRATIGATRIGHGTKIDNLVHIAHNVSIGKGCLVTAMVAIAGSSTIGDFCIFAGQSGVAPHVTVGDRTIIAAKAGVTKSLEGGKVYAGMPAREIREQNKRDAVFRNIEKLTKRLQKIEENIESNHNE